MLYMYTNNYVYKWQNLAPEEQQHDIRFERKSDVYQWTSMRVRVVDDVFGAFAMALYVHLWVGFETCYWEHYIHEMHLIQA